ncbi:hypothetical protein [Hymenobacter sp. YC55]|uniref:hypothetical protein n=1 Tax=Hymenobacter sp. YC55 TaxID=3034019 RepID=UPI0023F79EA1|nr:hypothetical protein [Hymenobacter sp. YC55]MDF7810484.1 hypothetical protein [Hymenobacter sp. YC55]
MTSKRLSILDKKTFRVGNRLVQIRKQDKFNSDKPHQIHIKVTIKGVTMMQTHSYEAEGVANRDEKYAYFDEEIAQKVVEGFLRFLANPPKDFKEAANSTQEGAQQ